MKLLAVLIICWTLPLQAVTIPTNLDGKDRASVVEILGMGTSSKLLTIPYPLGGFSGIEMGVSVESLPVDNLSRLGNKTKRQTTFNYPKISLGKGLYNDLDLYVHFIPFNESTGLTEYGGIIRWTMYKSTLLPANIALVLHGNSSNIDNLFISDSVGADLVAGINVNYISLYFGYGQVQVRGRFAGGVNGITDSGREETSAVSKGHAIIGGSIFFDPYFVAFQIDQYDTTVMSGKVGIRF
jgi:hypothetical protein